MQVNCDKPVSRWKGNLELGGTEDEDSKSEAEAKGPCKNTEPRRVPGFVKFVTFLFY